MKQIDNMQKKAYTKPAIKVFNIGLPDLICTSGDPKPDPEPRWYDNEID